MKEDIERVTKNLDNHRHNLLMEMDCIDNTILNLDDYDFMIEFAIKKGFERVIDIGCAYGHQSELCRNRLNYIGINENKLKFYNSNESFTEYIKMHYPDKRLLSYINDIAISNLCLGWNCYKYSDDEFDKQFEALKMDFKACILHVPTEVEEILKKYFNNVEVIKKENEIIIPTAFYYCH